MRFIGFLTASLKVMLSGGAAYRRWMLALGAVVVYGAFGYAHQFKHGLVVTGMSDQVPWGIYISNFTYIVGLAAAGVLVVIPAYVFHRDDAESVVKLAEGIAVAACTMCMLFVTVDLGRPDRAWHLIPGIGMLNWPTSLLAWDVIVLQGYWLLNLFIPMYLLYKTYIGEKPNKKLYYPAVYLSMFWAISIHTVTAFLLAADVARPFWHSALLAPRFLASAFTSGPAMIVLAFLAIDRLTDFKVNRKVIDMLAIIMTIALQINLFMLGSEIFVEFYMSGHHTINAHYLFVGVGGYDDLVPWIYTAIGLEVVAVGMLMLRGVRQSMPLLVIACLAAVIGIWIDKGMGLIIPGFIPTTLGEFFEYNPTWTEIRVSAGIWALGAMIFTALARPAIAIETGRLRLKEAVSESYISPPHIG